MKAKLMEKPKEININLLYKVPSNQTPEDLVRMDSNYSALQQEIIRLKEVVAFQSSRIDLVSNKIIESQQENLKIKAEISRLKTSKKPKKSSRIKKKKIIHHYSNKESVHDSEVSDICQSYTDMQRISDLEKLLQKNDDELLILDKRLQIAETLLGLKLF